MSEPRPALESIAAIRGQLAERRPPPPDVDLDDAEGMEELRRRSTEELRELRWRALCPQRFHRATLADLPADVAADLKAWLAMAPRPNLVIVGPVGAGKTHAALAAVREDYLTHGIDAEFVPVTELLDLLRPGGPEHAFADLVDVPRLIVDDLGTERVTDWTAERVGALVNRRWLEERPVVVTSNLAPADMVAAVGERVASRLLGSGAVVLAMTSDDRRFGDG